MSQQPLNTSATPIAIAVVEHQEAFLVGQRPPGVPLAGFWEFPGGKIDCGESPGQAAVRECREETGIEVEVVGLYLEHEQPYSHGRVHLHFLSCHPKTPEALPRGAFRWVRRAELAHLIFPEGNRQLLQELLSK